MIPQWVWLPRSRVLAATNPKSDEKYGAAYQTLLWASLYGDDFSSDGDNREVP